MKALLKVVRTGRYADNEVPQQVHIAPFLLRIYAFSKAGILPTSVIDGLDALPNFSKWAKATISQPSVLKIWDEKEVIAGTVARLEKMKAAANGANGSNGTK
jgi:glutathione S-transferase